MKQTNFAHASLRDRLKLGWKTVQRAGIFAVTGKWEGSEFNRYRRRPPVSLTDQDWDLDLGSREALLSEARDLCRKFGLPNRILRQFANYVVGQASVQWLTEDTGVNDQYEDAFASWSAICDFKGRLNLRKMARLAIMSRKRDGDVFFLERNDGGFYSLEAIEGDRVGNILGQTNVDTERVIGGCVLDVSDRVRAYRVLTRTQYGTFKDPTDIPAWKMIHFTDSTRFDSYRGVTAFHVALNDIRDLKETKDAAKLKQKLASKLAIAVKNATGGPLPGINPLSDDTNEKGEAIKTEDVGDVAIQYMFNGDSMDFINSEFPHESWFKLTELLIRDIAIGLDLPVEFVWNMSGLTGPAVRMMSRQAERTFKAEQDDIEESFFNRVIARWLANEVTAGRLPDHPQMLRFKVQRPAHPSIDAGRESTANLNERKMCVKSGTTIAEETGEDIYDTHLQIERETDDKLERASRLAEKYGLSLEAALSAMTAQSVALAQEAVPAGGQQGGNDARP